MAKITKSKRGQEEKRKHSPSLDPHKAAQAGLGCPPKLHPPLTFQDLVTWLRSYLFRDSSRLFEQVSGPLFQPPYHPELLLPHSDPCTGPAWTLTHLPVAQTPRWQGPQCAWPIQGAEKPVGLAIVSKGRGRGR